MFTPTLFYGDCRDYETIVGKKPTICFAQSSSGLNQCFAEGGDVVTWEFRFKPPG
jgi:hypothetical protein